jgi:hypothetical protein
VLATRLGNRPFRIAVTVFAHTGRYATAATFTTGFTQAIWACAAISALSTVAAFLTRAEQPSVAEREILAPPVAAPNRVEKVQKPGLTSRSPLP